jgi:hypothetical protein
MIVNKRSNLSQVQFTFYLLGLLEEPLTLAMPWDQRSRRRSRLHQEFVERGFGFLNLKACQIFIGLCVSQTSQPAVTHTQRRREEQSQKSSRQEISCSLASSSSHLVTQSHFLRRNAETRARRDSVGYYPTGTNSVSFKPTIATMRIYRSTLEQ